MGNELSQHVEQSQKSGILQLKNFKLQKVPNEIFDVARNLRTLDLSLNKIQQLPVNLLQNLVNLKTLNLDNNKINFIPNEISCLVKLENLSLNSNELDAIPSTIRQLKNLKKLNLSKNHIKKFPYELGEIKLIDFIDLSQNKIETIDETIKNLDCIELNLNENRIRSLSDGISKCQRLKVLRLEQNLLELPAIPTNLLAESKVSLLCVDGNLFTEKQFQQLDGYDKYIERYTATKRKFD